MASAEKPSMTQPHPVDTHSWGQVLANCLWVVTFLMVLAFFWQSIGAMLAK